MSTQFQIQKAVKANVKARLALIGPSGSGKTYTALSIAQGLAGGGRVVVIDTERGSASMYANEFDFDTLQLPSFSPETYTAAIKHCVAAGYQVIIIDSLSHAWMGKDGALELVDQAAARERGNSFAGWRSVTPLHNEMVDTIISCGAHIIATMRSKAEWVVEKDEKGKMVPRKIGLQPVQRDGMEYEFDLTADIDVDHRMAVAKTRLRFLDGKVLSKPGRELGEQILADIMSGVAAPQETVPAIPEPAPAATPDFDAPGGTSPQRVDAMTRDQAMSLDPNGITDRTAFNVAMIALGIDNPDAMGAAKAAAGFGEDKLKDLDTVALQCIFATTQANMMTEAVA